MAEIDWQNLKMRLEKLILFNFKNYGEAKLFFEGNIHCFLGKNGSGKTNILDAIYYLSFTRSFTSATDTQNIRLDENQFFVKGSFLREDKRREVVCSFQSGQKKIVKEDGVDYAKFSGHIGKYPVVMVAPQDIELIWDGSEVRRRFFDSLISQFDHKYLDHLITYTAYLKQRNSSLKLFQESGRVDYDLLEGYDTKLIESANYIFSKRQEVIAAFAPMLENHYRFLSDSAQEPVAIKYVSDLQEMSWADALKKNLHRDLLLQRTTTGIHRDDYRFFLCDQELKRFGSQGQQKSFLIGLKLAEFESLATAKNLKPILLLDDIFDKLDDLRIHKLMQLVARDIFGQIFITDARPDRTRDILKQAGVKAELFEIENGKLKKHG